MEIKERLERIEERIEAVEFTESKGINYKDILKVSDVIRHLQHSAEAAHFEDGGKNGIVLDTDKYISLFTDKLTPEQYDIFDEKKAEAVLHKYAKDYLKKNKSKWSKESLDESDNLTEAKDTLDENSVYWTGKNEAVMIHLSNKYTGKRDSQGRLVDNIKNEGWYLFKGAPGKMKPTKKLSVKDATDYVIKTYEKQDNN